MRKALLIGVVLAIPAVLIGWFAWDRSGDRVAPGVTLEGTPVGRLDRAAVAARVETLASDARSTVITIDSPGTDIEVMPGDIGISIDEAATLDAVMGSGRDGSLVDGFRHWVQSFWDATNVELQWTIDPAIAERSIDDLPESRVAEPEEPSVVIDDDEIVVIVGVPGTSVDAGATTALIASEYRPGRPLVVSAELADIAPHTDDTSALEFAAEVERATQAGVVVELFDVVGRIGRPTLLQHTLIEFGASDPVFGFDPDGLESVLIRLFGDVTEPGSDPVFEVVDGEPALVEPGSPPIGCCAPEAGAELAGALLAGDTGPIPISPAPVGNVVLEDWAGGGGVVEVVGEFTTNHRCCESRVTNIHRIADLIRGQYLLPGESFSVNDFVGERTTEKGFVAAGVIERGSFTQDVGGGISQFATTFFNAAFFAGLELDEYQSHSIYISRYPYGREATLSFPVPDLKVTNTTEYPVLIWTSYTDTSITVTMYSTRHIVVEETGQTEEPFGACTQVETFRRRTYPDGRVVEDSVSARYRPGEGLDCNGNPVGS